MSEQEKIIEFIYKLSRWSIAVIFFYHGLVPKILFENSQEVLMNETLMPMVSKKFALISSGVLEILYGILLIVLFKSKWLIYPALIFGSLITFVLLMTLPEMFKNAFNPFSINFALCVLCLINIKTHSLYIKS